MITIQNQTENKKENSSMSSTNEGDSDLSSNNEEYAKSKAVITNNENPDQRKEIEIKNKMLCSMPKFRETPFCNAFNAPTDNQETIDNALNELTSEKKKGDRVFHTGNTTCMTRRKNHCADVHVRDSASSTYKP